MSAILRRVGSARIKNARPTDPTEAALTYPSSPNKERNTLPHISRDRSETPKKFATSRRLRDSG